MGLRSWELPHRMDTVTTREKLVDAECSRRSSESGYDCLHTWERVFSSCYCHSRNLGCHGGAHAGNHWALSVLFNTSEPTDQAVGTSSIESWTVKKIEHQRIDALELWCSRRLLSISWSLFRFMSIEFLMPFNHLILCSPFSSRPQSFPASGSFPMNQLFASGGQSIGTSALASVLPMNIQGWFPLGLCGLISLQSKGLSRVFSNTIVQKHQFFGAQPSLWSNSHIHTWLLEKPITLTIQTFVSKAMSLLFNILSSILQVYEKPFFQGASVFSFHGCSHHLQWFWSPRM